MAQSMAGATAGVAQASGASSTAIRLMAALSGAVILLMMLLGLLMRLAQGGTIAIDAAFFYQLMTAHGAGMVGIAGFGGATIMWCFVAREVALTEAVLWAFIGIFLIGVVFVLGGIFIGGFGGAWTFLYPLPAISLGVWSTGAAASFMLGLTLIGVAFLLFYVEIGRALIARYGGLGRALGWPLLFTGKQDDVPPPSIIAAAAVTVFNTIGIVVGAAVLLASLVNLYVPAFAIDALLAKNMIYFFGHVFINATIYMAVIAVYAIVPEYTGRQWKSSRLFVGAWTAVLVMVLAVYPHHLLQDVVMPGWALVVGQIVSYLSGLPVIAVTAFSLLAYLHRAGVKWDLTLALLTLGVFGWAAGVVPAIVDATIVVNKVLHNTLWVPGHFHFYLLLGMVAMLLGFMAWLVRGRPATEADPDGGPGWLFWTYLVGGLGFVLVFLVAGAMSVPRRWAVHLPEWMLQDRIGSLLAAVVIIATSGLVLRFLVRWRQAGAG